MQMVDNARVVVYLVNGFLEAGKTQFLNQTLEQEYFKVDGKTVLIRLEEGVEEYDEKLLKRTNTILMTVDDPEEITKDFLNGIDILYNPERVIFECNGMYPVSKMEALDVPKGWGLVQEITIVDATTFDMYVTNMKSLFADMVRNAELVIFNRCTEDMPLAKYRRNVKAVNQGAEIVFEGPDGAIENIFTDEMPYDLNAPVVQIDDMDFGIFYIDMIDHPKTYTKKTVEFKGKVLKSLALAKDEVVVGRKAMTCCEDDLTFLGYICKGIPMDMVKAGQWVKVTGEVGFAFKKAYGGRGPVIAVKSWEVVGAPKQELVYFN